MNHIPVEILHEIFARLDLKDRLKCMLVCRFWYDTLDRLTLLYHLDIKNTQFYKLKYMLVRFPHRAAQVEYLKIHERLDPNFDKRELCNMFPNLRQFNMSEYCHQESRVHMSKNFPYLHAVCKLEKLKETGECKMALQLATSDLCNNLKTLELRFLMNDSSSSNRIISQLKNMPVLQELRVSLTKFQLTELEIMHFNLPTIKRLYLNNVILIPGEMPKDVVPASLITELEMKINNTDEVRTQIQFYEYFGNKYASVKNPILENEMGTCGHPDDVLEIYKEGIVPLHRKIGYPVDTFSVRGYYKGLDAFRQFDEFGIELKQVKLIVSELGDDAPFLEELVQSQQSQSVQKIILEDAIPESLYLMSNLKALKTLDISGSYFHVGVGVDVDESDEEEEEEEEEEEVRIMRNEINFTQLIGACPETLTTLILDNINLKYDGPTSKITSIKDLTITEVEITPLLTTIIETSFPKLSTFKLTGEITSDVTISLLNHNLKEVNFTAMYDEEKNRSDYSIESKCDGDIHCHTIKRTPNRNGDGHLYTYYSRDKLAVKREPSFALKFICPSVEQLSFSTKRKWEKY